MKVMLTKDVFKLGRAGDVKKVADGYGRNFLIPQKLAVLATPGAMKQVERIRAQAEIRRNAENEELKGLADEIAGVELTFAAKAGETDKLYGSITTQNVADALQEKTRYEIKRHQIDMQPIRMLGVFTASVRLTMDLVPEIKIIVHREGESAEDVLKTEETAEEEKPVSEADMNETAEAEELVKKEPSSEEEAPIEAEASSDEVEEAVSEETSEEDKE